MDLLKTEMKFIYRSLLFHLIEYMLLMLSTHSFPTSCSTRSIGDHPYGPPRWPARISPIQSVCSRRLSEGKVIICYELGQSATSVSGSLSSVVVFGGVYYFSFREVTMVVYTVLRLVFM